MSDELLATAEYLLDRPTRRTSADLCRAQSAIYYALFHTLAKLTADFFVGTNAEERPERAWRHVYRGLDHGKIANKCKSGKIDRFPQAIKDFAEFFLHAQYMREKSDYEFGYAPDSGRLGADIERARVKRANLLACREVDLRAFCVFVFIEKHRHEDTEQNRALPR